MDPFSVAFFSDPPVAGWVLPELLKFGIPISSIVSIFPAATRIDFPAAIQEIADARGIPFFRPVSLDEPSFVREFEKTGPSVIASWSFLRKIPQQILAIPRLGGINCHPALLPKYRGSFPYFWVILNADKESGVTIHRMTDQYDAGDIHLSQAFPVEATETTER